MNLPRLTPLGVLRVVRAASGENGRDRQREQRLGTHNLSRRAAEAAMMWKHTERRFESLSPPPRT